MLVHTLWLLIPFSDFRTQYQFFENLLSFGAEFLPFILFPKTWAISSIWIRIIFKLAKFSAR